MKWLIACVFTLLIACGEKWSPYYVSLFSGDDLTVVGQIHDFEVPCEAGSTVHSRCTNAYKIPIKQHEAHSHMGLGAIISASKIACNNREVTFDDPTNPGRRFDLMTHYQVVDY